MFRSGMKLVLAAALAATPVVVLPTVAQAQQPDTQRAYQAGYNNGVNDRNQNKPLNLSTGNWKGVNLQAYQRGYEDGYRRTGNGRGYNGNYGYAGHYGHYGYNQPGYHGAPAYGNPGYYGGAQNADTQRAYQAGFNNGVNDRSRNKPMNLSTGNWKGVNLQAYQRGYEEGYHRGRR